MKSLLIIQESLDGGGAERILIEYLNNIDYNQYNVTLLLIFGGGRYVDEINKNVHCLELYGKSIKPKKRVQEVVLYNKCVLTLLAKSILKGKTFDTILSFMEGPSLLVHQVLIGKATHHVTWVHTNIITNPWSERLFSGAVNEAKAYKRMNSIAFVSLQAQKAFVEKYPEVKASLYIINNPIDVERIRCGANEMSITKPDNFTVCSMGRMIEAKRFDRLIDAAKILKDKGCKITYWLCGTGKLEEDIKEQIHANKLEEDFVLFGFQKNPYPYIKASDVFVLTSDTEGFPTVICESMVLGKPIISTDVPGTDELLGASEFGIVCQKTPESVADAILKLYTDNNTLVFFKQKSMEHCKMFNIESTMNKFYHAICNFEQL